MVCGRVGLSPASLSPYRSELGHDWHDLSHSRLRPAHARPPEHSGRHLEQSGEPLAAPPARSVVRTPTPLGHTSVPYHVSLACPLPQLGAGRALCRARDRGPPVWGWVCFLVHQGEGHGRQVYVCVCVHVCVCVCVCLQGDVLVSLAPLSLAQGLCLVPGTTSLDLASSLTLTAITMALMT